MAEGVAAAAAERATGGRKRGDAKKRTTTTAHGKKVAKKEPPSKGGGSAKKKAESGVAGRPTEQLLPPVAAGGLDVQSNKAKNEPDTSAGAASTTKRHPDDDGPEPVPSAVLAKRPQSSAKRPPDDGPEHVPSAVLAKRPKYEDLAAASAAGGAIVPKKTKPPRKRFVIPRPGVDGAAAGCYEGRRFVLTGEFPEVGGGTGLSLGKDRVRGMIESFGGRVTSAVSGVTSFLVVGKNPGFCKVKQAKAKGIPLVDLKALRERIMGEIPSLEHVQAPAITQFSAGYINNRIGY